MSQQPSSYPGVIVTVSTLQHGTILSGTCLCFLQLRCLDLEDSMDYAEVGRVCSLRTFNTKYLLLWLLHALQPLFGLPIHPSPPLLYLCTAN